MSVLTYNSHILVALPEIETAGVRCLLFEIGLNLHPRPLQPLLYLHLLLVLEHVAQIFEPFRNHREPALIAAVREHIAELLQGHLVLEFVDQHRPVRECHLLRYSVVELQLMVVAVHRPRSSPVQQIVEYLAQRSDVFFQVGRLYEQLHVVRFLSNLLILLYLSNDSNQILLERDILQLELATDELDLVVYPQNIPQFQTYAVSQTLLLH